MAARPFDEAPRWEYLKWLKTQKDPSHQDRAKLMALQMDAALSKPWDALALELSETKVTYEASFKIPKSIHLPMLKWVRLQPIASGLADHSVFTVSRVGNRLSRPSSND